MKHESYTPQMRDSLVGRRIDWRALENSGAVNGCTRSGEYNQVAIVPTIEQNTDGTGDNEQT